jgi:hypothetical protein
MWTLLMELQKEQKQLNVNQKCIHRTVWNITCGMSAPHCVMLFVTLGK